MCCVLTTTVCDASTLGVEAVAICLQQSRDAYGLCCVEEPAVGSDCSLLFFLQLIPSITCSIARRAARKAMQMCVLSTENWWPWLRKVAGLASRDSVALDEKFPGSAVFPPRRSGTLLPGIFSTWFQSADRIFPSLIPAMITVNVASMR